MLPRHISVIFWIVYLIIIIGDVKTIRKSGPYVMVPTRYDDCDDVGTNQVRFGRRMSREGNRMLIYTNNITFEVPWDDKLEITLEFQQLKNGAYTFKFVTLTLNSCENAWKYGQTMFKSFFGAAGYNMTKCPLPAGTYSVKDWEINMHFNYVSSFFNGSYKIIVSYTRDKKRVGCNIIYADAIPK